MGTVFRYNEAAFDTTVSCFVFPLILIMPIACSAYVKKLLCPMECFLFICIYQIYAPQILTHRVHAVCLWSVAFLGGSYATGALSAFVKRL